MTHLHQYYDKHEVSHMYYMIWRLQCYQALTENTVILSVMLINDIHSSSSV